MSSRILLALVIAGAVATQFVSTDPAAAREGYWQGDTSNTWNVAQNWFVVGAPGDGSFVPQAQTQFTRAIIGTDSPNGALNSTLAPFGSPVINGTLPTPKDTIGGLYLGLRELNYGVTPPVTVNPAPAAGTLVGALTITAGTLNNISTTHVAQGADGRIVIGADGRGYLTMTGGTLTGLQLLVDGENVTTGNGTSLVDLSGSSTIAIANSPASSGSATFNRRLRVQGPNVNFSATGNIRFGSGNSYTAAITSTTSHSTLKTNGNGFISGALNVDFTGMAGTPAIGQTWDLVDAVGVISGGFNNLGLTGDVPTTGLSSTPPVGAAYRTQVVTAGSGHKVLQLVYDRLLVLRVNRDTGELSITNPLNGNIGIDSYTVSSTFGSLINTYKGISGAPAGDTNWSKLLPTANNLSEVKDDPSGATSALSLNGVPSLSLGTNAGKGFDPKAVAASFANFGKTGEDLVFQYSSPGKGIVYGQVEYVGTQFTNNLALRVNPNTGQAFVKNDSLVTLKIDGYSILSSQGGLSGAGFTGLGGSWDSTTPATSSLLSQTNLLSSTTLAPGQQLAVGNISNNVALSNAVKNGLSLQFTISDAFGDYNNDGTVNAADFTVWRDHFGELTTLPNDGTPGTVTQADFDVWRQYFGQTGETTFRSGAVVFDTLAGAGGGGFAGNNVPEPSTACLLLFGIGAIVALGRLGHFGLRPKLCRAAASVQQVHGQAGARTMSRQSQRGWMLVAALTATLFAASSASAATGGIALTNGTFELPGPPGAKVFAFDTAGAPIAGVIPGWTFPGPGVENFGHDGMGGSMLRLGDSGTEGGGNPGNEMLLSTFDGVAYQTSTFPIVSIPTTQVYRLTFDGHDIFTINAMSQQFTTSQNQLSARIYYDNAGTRTTLGSPLVISNTPNTATRYTLDIDPALVNLAPAIGKNIGVEFDVTSNTFNALVAHSWSGFDNVLLQIAGKTKGDLNGDGVVNTTDYNIVRDNQQKSLSYLSDGDLTSDGLINLDDFRVFKRIFSGAGAGGTGGLGDGNVPEPSTAILSMIAAAAALGLSRYRRLTMTGTKRGWLCALIALIAGLTMASESKATVLAYDPFYLPGQHGGVGEYNPSTPGDPNAVPPVAPTFVPLSGQNPSTGSFFAGPWHARSNGDAPRVSVQQTGLSYLGSPAAGGATTINQTNVPAGGSADGRIGRNLATPWDGTTVGTYFISFVVNFGAMPANNLSGDMGYRAVEFRDLTGMSDLSEASANGYIGYNAYYWPSPVAPGQTLQRAPGTGRMTFQFGGGNNYQVIENSPLSFNQDGATHLVVLKFQMTTDPVSGGVGGDSISVWLDPVSAATEAGDPTKPLELPGATLTGLDFNLGVISAATQYGSQGGTNVITDEFRVATTYAEALPALPLPGDVNSDGHVDLADYTIIAAHYNQAVASSSLGDVANVFGKQGSNGRVDIGDYRLWRDNRTDVPHGAGGLGLPPGGVPEPSSVILALMAMLGASFMARRRNCLKSDR